MELFIFSLLSPGGACFFGRLRCAREASPGLMEGLGELVGLDAYQQVRGVEPR